ncbi:Maf family protein [Rubrivirga sp. IMCC45206]|uniref:Maf family protein n=1 Tax=Rubrivirga sp. IMCC45206 TaxID=3391614 RepID=UPI0039903551
MLTLHAPFVLASASPRRRVLLDRLGLTFEVRPTDSDETWPLDLATGPAAEAVALRKARAIDASGTLVLAADTVVVLDGDVLGKPADEAEARATLRRLSGRTHHVTTGLALRLDGREATAHETTAVTFADLSDAEIAAYAATGSPLDKAGSYGIQDDAGALLVARIDGDYFNVVGLPLRRLYETLSAFAPSLVSVAGRPRS